MPRSDMVADSVLGTAMKRRVQGHFQAPWSKALTATKDSKTTLHKMSISPVAAVGCGIKNRAQPFSFWSLLTEPKQNVLIWSAY